MSVSEETLQSILNSGHYRIPKTELRLVRRIIADWRWTCEQLFDGLSDTDACFVKTIRVCHNATTGELFHVGLAVRLGESPDSNRFYVVDQLDRLTHVFQHALHCVNLGFNERRWFEPCGNWWEMDSVRSSNTCARCSSGSMDSVIFTGYDYLT